MEIEPGTTNNHLPLLFESQFPELVDPGLVDYCDAHDLIAAVSTRTQNVAVIRINGQLAFHINRKDPEAGVTALKWKPDGSLLGIGWSDGTIGFYSGEDGKLLSQRSAHADEERDEWSLDLESKDELNRGEGGVHGIKCLGWTTYQSAEQKASAPIEAESGLSTQQWFDDLDKGVLNGGIFKGHGSQLSGLAKSIATIDLKNILPRLSALPSHNLRFGPNEQKFTTQSSIDTLLEVERGASDSVTTLVNIGTSGTATISLDDSASIGSFDVGEQMSKTMHASNPECKSQVVLSASDSSDDLHLHYIDLPLEQLSGSLLQVVTTNTKRIRNLIAYITQTIRCMQSDFTSNLQLPTRIIENISEELVSKAEDDLVTSLYELAMTGEFTPSILEWLTDTVRENTHKHWDKHVNDMYAHLQTHIFVHLIPALDRLAIAVDAIRRHALFHATSDSFISLEPFAKLLDDIDSLRLVAQKVQLLVITEHRRFRAFSKWLRVMIDIGQAGPNTKAAVETEEREIPNVDYNLVMAYIRETLMRSELSGHLEQMPEMKGTCKSTEFWKHPVVTASGHDEVVSAVQKTKYTGEIDDDISSPHFNIPAITARIAAQTRLALASIAQWRGGMLSKPTTLTIPASVVGHRIFDLKLHPYPSRFHPTATTTQILHTSPLGSGTSEVALTESLQRSPSDIELKGGLFPRPLGELLDAKILDRDRCLVLTRNTNDEGRVLSICSSEKGGPEDELFREIQVFESNAGFLPDSLIIGGRARRMVCVCLNKRSAAFRVLDLEREIRGAISNGKGRA